MISRPDTSLRILQLLLRCGMVCQEELDIVLEMLGTAQTNRKAVPPCREVSGSQSRQSNIVFEFD